MEELTHELHDVVDDLNTIKKDNLEFYCLKEIKVHNFRKLFRSLTNFIDGMGYHIDYSSFDYKKDAQVKILHIKGGIKAIKSEKMTRKKIRMKIDWGQISHQPDMVVPHLKMFGLYVVIAALIVMVFGAISVVFPYLAKYMANPKLVLDPAKISMDFLGGMWGGLEIFLIYLLVPACIIAFLLEMKLHGPKRPVIREKKVNGTKMIMIQFDGEVYSPEHEVETDLYNNDSDSTSDVTMRIAGGVYPKKLKNAPNFDEAPMRADLENVYRKIDSLTSEFGAP
jgi:hypothetical protein